VLEMDLVVGTLGSCYWRGLDVRSYYCPLNPIGNVLEFAVRNPLKHNGRYTYRPALIFDSLRAGSFVDRIPVEGVFPHPSRPALGSTHSPVSGNGSLSGGKAAEAWC
jgi:hypothetical protein